MIEPLGKYCKRFRKKEGFNNVCKIIQDMYDEASKSVKKYIWRNREFYSESWYSSKSGYYQSKKFKYLGTIVKKNERIGKNVSIIIRCYWVNWREATKALYDKKYH